MHNISIQLYRSIRLGMCLAEINGLQGDSLYGGIQPLLQAFRGVDRMGEFRRPLARSRAIYAESGSDKCIDG